MRTIKFRGKRVDDDEWVYGDLIIDNAENYFIHRREEKRQEASMVYPDTIGQLTGLLDKNGKEIYEGDIVNFDNYIQGTSKVMFAEGCYMAVAKNYATPLTFRLSNHAIVIGNMYDNPELLKQ